MRRALVLTDEVGPAPVPGELPPHVREERKPRSRAMARTAAVRTSRDFLLAYCACFVAVSAFIV